MSVASDYAKVIDDERGSPPAWKDLDDDQRTRLYESHKQFLDHPDHLIDKMRREMIFMGILKER